MPWAALQRSHAQSDLSSTILDIHTAGAVPFQFHRSLGATASRGAETWAEHLATTGELNHDPNGGAENIAGFFKGVSAPGEGQSMWSTKRCIGMEIRVRPGKCAVIIRI